MKRIVIAAMALQGLWSCTAPSNGSFEVTGKIINLPPQKVLLQELPLDGTAPIVLDSGTLSKDGSFELKSKGKEQGLYFVGVPNGPQAIFINDNDKITIRMDAKDFRKPKIEGSDATQNLYGFIDNYLAKDSVIQSTYYAIDTLQKQGGSDSAVTVLQTQGLQQVSSLNEYVKRFAAESNSPAAIHFAISQCARNQTMEPKDLLAIAAAASDRFKTHKGLAVLKSRLSMLAAQSETPPYDLLNKPAPDLTLTDVNGKPTSISSFKGKYLLVDFWASWCGPCRMENPNVVMAYNKYKDKNFTILGVSLDQDKASWLAAIQKDHLTWNHMSDLKYWESEAVKTYKFDGIPFNVLIDPRGTIIASSLRGQDLDKKLAEVLK